MGHERSETTEDYGGWQNVYGRQTPQAGQPLPLLHPFERDVYGSREEAEQAAAMRSWLYWLPMREHLTKQLDVMPPQMRALYLLQMYLQQQGRGR